jgi:hypothetical protein
MSRSTVSLISDAALHFGNTADLDVQLKYMSDRTIFHVRYFIPVRSNVNSSLNPLLASVTQQIPPTPPQTFEQTLELRNIDNDIIALNAVCARGGSTLAVSYPRMEDRDRFVRMVLMLWAFITLGKLGALGLFSPDLFKDYAITTYWGRKAVQLIVIPILTNFLSSRCQLQEDKNLDDGLFEFAECLQTLLQSANTELDEYNDYDVDLDICDEVRKRLAVITGNLTLRAVQAFSANQFKDIAQMSQKIESKVDRTEYETIAAKVQDFETEKRKFEFIRTGIEGQAAAQLATMSTAMDRIQKSFEKMTKNMEIRMDQLESTLNARMKQLETKYADIMREKQRLYSMGLLSEKTANAFTQKVINRLDMD